MLLSSLWKGGLPSPKICSGGADLGTGGSWRELGSGKRGSFLGGAELLGALGEEEAAAAGLPESVGASFFAEVEGTFSSGFFLITSFFFLLASAEAEPWSFSLIDLFFSSI
ncbi:major facilitator superfamily MFS1 [Leptospira johnsonii]|uniref:Major facilitator superfamily MFS1 n=1 Tax=Leptospira johnsonii TaxID=1917820 RepID=A0A2P2D224_9LEPT|nr:major facilitator superfamily MFS1 [Leptospira johnsonii]